MDTTKYDLPNNRVLKVIQDNQGCCESPREWDNVCQMIFIGPNSGYGDTHNFHDKHESLEAHEEFIAKKLDVAYIAKVYGYSHSGMTISLEPFSCPWDSGVLGWVVMTKEALRENYGVQRVTQKLIEKAMVHVKGEVKTLDQYITGDIYGFQVVKVETCDKGCDHEEIEDSCWGFFGSDISENGILDNLSEEDREAVKEKL